MLMFYAHHDEKFSHKILSQFLIMNLHLYVHIVREFRALIKVQFYPSVSIFMKNLSPHVLLNFHCTEYSSLKIVLFENNRLN